MATKAGEVYVATAATRPAYPSHTTSLPGYRRIRSQTVSINSSSLLSAATSSDTLVPGSPHSIPTSPQCGSPQKLTVSSIWVGFKNKKDTTPLSVRIPTSNQLDALALSSASSPKFGHVPSPARHSTSPATFSYNNRAPSPVPRRSKSPSPPVTVSSPNIQRACSPISFSYSSPNIIANLAKSRSSKSVYINPIYERERER